MKWPPKFCPPMQSASGITPSVICKVGRPVKNSPAALAGISRCQTVGEWVHWEEEDVLVCEGVRARAAAAAAAAKEEERGDTNRHLAAEIARIRRYCGTSVRSI